MPLKEIPIKNYSPRPKVKDPTNPGQTIDVPDCANYAYGEFMHPPVADERDLPSKEDK